MLYVGGEPYRQGRLGRQMAVLESGGELVLGQASRERVHFDPSLALDGDLSHLNIWNSVLTKEEVS